MLQPVTRAWALGILLMLTAAEAQPSAARARRVTIAANPGEPLPEVRVAAASVTVIVLDAPVDKTSVQVDSTRVRLVDVGERTLVLEPVVTPADKERWVLRVRYADAAQPEWAAFALVSQPGEVDLQVTAVRQRQTLESCQATLAEAQARRAGTRAEVWVLADRLGGSSAVAQPLNIPPMAHGWVYRFETSVLLVLTPTSAAGLELRTPIVATLRPSRKGSAEVRVRAVHVREAPLAPGAEGTLAVEADLPPPDVGGRFTLELRDESGQILEVKEVTIPLAVGEERSAR